MEFFFPSLSMTASILKLTSTCLTIHIFLPVSVKLDNRHRWSGLDHFSNVLDHWSGVQNMCHKYELGGFCNLVCKNCPISAYVVPKLLPTLF